jgi:hypothetical protein
MEKYIGPLLLACTAAGVVWLVVAAWWLLGRKRLSLFRKIVLVFVCAGAGVPIAILPIWDWINAQGNLAAMGRIQDVAQTIWPTSIELALDSPGGAHWNAIAAVYAISILGNMGAYGIVGLAVGSSYVRLRGNSKA